MQSLDLFQPPIARNTDPRTSLNGERYMNESGKRKDHQALLLAAIKSHPGCTAQEYGEFLWRAHDMHPFKAFQMANKRMPDLESKNLVVSIGERMCTVSKRSARIWKAQ